MEFRKLSQAGLEVSQICLGTMTFGEQTSLEEGHRQIAYARKSELILLIQPKCILCQVEKKHKAQLKRS